MSSWSVWIARMCCVGSAWNLSHIAPLIFTLKQMCDILHWQVFYQLKRNLVFNIFKGCDSNFEVYSFPFFLQKSCFEWNNYLALNNMYLDSAWNIPKVKQTWYSHNVQPYHIIYWLLPQTRATKKHTETRTPPGHFFFYYHILNCPPNVYM